MKKYIWVSLYFVWLVMLSYTFFYFSWKWKQLETQKSVVEIESGLNSQNTIVKESKTNKNENTEDDRLTKTHKSNDKLNELEDIKVEPVLEKKETSKWLKESWENAAKISKKDSLKKELIIWKVKLSYVKYIPYMDIYELLWYTGDGYYQVPWKDIYLKQLKSIDYESEKNNINQLIQKVWGNIKQTNLFGDKQLFVNIDVYFKKVVIMLVSYNGKLYLITLPYNNYSAYKSYLNNDLFVKK